MYEFDAVPMGRDAAALLLRQGFAVLEIGDCTLEEEAFPVFAGLRHLRSLDPAEMRRWEVDRSLGRPTDPDDGLILRRADLTNPASHDARPADNKNVFMFRPQLRGWLAQRGLGLGSDWDPFWDSQWSLWYSMYLIAQKVGYELDALTGWRYGILGGLLRTVGETKLRSQTYIDRRSDASDQIAKPHPDRSCLTVHLLEDHPGLTIRPDGTPASERLVPATRGRVVVFAGTQLQIMTGGVECVDELADGRTKTTVTGGLVRALIHGAHLVDTPEQPWRGYRNMCVGFVKGFHDSNDKPYDVLEPH